METLVDRMKRRTQRLCHHLPAVDPAPLVRRAQPDPGVGAVCLKLHDFGEGLRCTHAVSIRVTGVLNATSDVSCLVTGSATWSGGSKRSDT